MRVGSTLLCAVAFALPYVRALSEADSIDAFTNFLDHYLSPHNAQVAASINSTLFAEDVKGSVDLSTNFDSRELSTEYLFGLFVSIEKQDKGRPNPIGVPLSYNVTHLMAKNNYVFGSVKFDFYYPTIDVHYPIQVDAWLLFNEQKEIQQYDVSFRRWAWAMDTITPALLPQMAEHAKVTTQDRDTIMREYMIPVICGSHDKHCHGPNKQYEDYEDCARFIRTKKVGHFYRMGEDNVLCRNLHVPMLHLRPEVHCDHIGPTGGDMCNRRDYAEVVLESHFPEGMIASDCADPIKLASAPARKPTAHHWSSHDELKRWFGIDKGQCHYNPYRAKWWRV